MHRLECVDALEHCNKTQHSQRKLLVVTTPNDVLSDSLHLKRTGRFILCAYKKRSNNYLNALTKAIAFNALPTWLVFTQVRVSLACSVHVLDLPEISQ